MYLRARRFASLSLDPKNLDREAGSTRQRFWRSGLRAEVATNRLGRQFHELRLHEIRVLSREIYSWGVTRSNGLASYWRSESYALQRYKHAADKSRSLTDLLANFQVVEAKGFKGR